MFLCLPSFQKKPKFSPISEFESAGDSAMIDSFEVCGPTVFNHYSATSTNQDTRNGFHCSENRINALQYDAFCSMTMNADNRTTGTVEQSSCDDSMQVVEPQNSNTSMDAETNHFDINNHRNDNASGQIIPVQLCNANGYNKFDDYR